MDGSVLDRAGAAELPVCMWTLESRVCVTCVAAVAVHCAACLPTNLWQAAREKR
jgi:hypothetical protein